jgi:menaquinone-dependent protoporphyrinogen oxidase
MRTLIAYATKHGSTREVADAIAATLREDGAAVDVIPAVDVREIAGYDAVVVGGALYMGKWHGDAQQFLRRHASALAEVPLAVFAMGPMSTADKEVASSRAQLDKALAKAEVAPASVAIFGGVIDPSTFRFPLNRMPASDARDWDAIEAWSHEVAALVPSAVLA